MTNFVLDPLSHEDNPAGKIVFALERLSHVFRIHWWEENKNFQLSPLQMQILIVLRFHPHLDSVSTISAHLKLSNATVSDAMRTLTQKGYVYKQIDSEDGRRRPLALSSAGIAAAEQLALFANQMQDFVNTLPNQPFLLESLLHLMSLLQQQGFIPLQRMCTSCRHFRHLPSDSPPYYCQLLQQPLEARDLRIHCAEHEEVV